MFSKDCFLNEAYFSMGSAMQVAYGVEWGDVFVSAECSEVMDTNTGGVVTKHSDILTDDVTDDRDDTKHHCDSVSVWFQSVNNDTKLFVDISCLNII